MRRILLVLSVALVMAAMMVASAMPAFAKGGRAGACESVFPEIPSHPSRSVPLNLDSDPGADVVAHGCRPFRHL